MRVFLDTSVLSDKLFSKVSEHLAERAVKGDVFHISVITHFELLWGYRTAEMSDENYKEFLRDFNVEVVPLLKADVEKAASLKPVKKDLLDALIASAVIRLKAGLMTFNEGDFKKFLKKDQIIAPQLE